MVPSLRVFNQRKSESFQVLPELVCLLSSFPAPSLIDEWATAKGDYDAARLFGRLRHPVTKPVELKKKPENVISSLLSREDPAVRRWGKYLGMNNAVGPSVGVPMAEFTTYSSPKWFHNSFRYVMLASTNLENDPRQELVEVDFLRPELSRIYPRLDVDLSSVECKPMVERTLEWEVEKKSSRKSVLMGFVVGLSPLLRHLETYYGPIEYIGYPNECGIAFVVAFPVAARVLKVQWPNHGKFKVSLMAIKDVEAELVSRLRARGNAYEKTIQAVEKQLLKYRVQRYTRDGGSIRNNDQVERITKSLPDEEQRNFWTQVLTAADSPFCWEGQRISRSFYEYRKGIGRSIAVLTSTQRCCCMGTRKVHGPYDPGSQKKWDILVYSPDHYHKSEAFEVSDPRFLEPGGELLKSVSLSPDFHERLSPRKTDLHGGVSKVSTYPVIVPDAPNMETFARTYPFFDALTYWFGNFTLAIHTQGDNCMKAAAQFENKYIVEIVCGDNNQWSVAIRDCPVSPDRVVRSDVKCSPAESSSLESSSLESSSWESD